MTKGNQQYKIKRTQVLDEKGLLRWLKKDINKEKSPPRLKRSTALTGGAFVKYWQRQNQVIVPDSITTTIESFSINFVTGESQVQFANQR
jgi:hypothetical protein